MRLIDLTGRKFGILTVIARADVAASHVHWNCVCDCGNTCRVSGINLRRGATKSCGCRQARVKHGRARRGQWTPEYSAWNSVMTRCYNKNDKGYQYWGGRGIRVCSRWHDVNNFIADMGPRPSPLHSIDRIDNDGDYEPSNCRWATSKQQTDNRRNSRLIEFDGRTQTLAQWASEVGLAWGTIAHRIRQGWSIERALRTPVARRRRA